MEIAGIFGTMATISDGIGATAGGITVKTTAIEKVLGQVAEVEEKIMEDEEALGIMEEEVDLDAGAVAVSSPVV